jgi:hypothetical protein
VLFATAAGTATVGFDCRSVDSVIKDCDDVDVQAQNPWTGNKVHGSRGPNFYQEGSAVQGFAIRMTTDAPLRAI